MRDWAIDYVLHVLEKTGWTMNDLAQRAGLSASTINRPLRERDWKHKLSRSTIARIHAASGIDPTPFAKGDLAEPLVEFRAKAPETAAARALKSLPPPTWRKGEINRISVACDGKIAEVHAVVDLAGLERLRRQLDAAEALMRAAEG